MIRQLGLLGGCQGRGESLGTLIAKSPTHPYLQLDSQASQDLCTSLAGEQAARMLRLPHRGMSEKSISAHKGGLSVANRAGVMGSKCFKSKNQTTCP